MQIDFLKPDTCYSLGYFFVCWKVCNIMIIMMAKVPWLCTTITHHYIFVFSRHCRISRFLRVTVNLDSGLCGVTQRERPAGKESSDAELRPTVSRWSVNSQCVCQSYIYSHRRYKSSVKLQSVCSEVEHVVQQKETERVWTWCRDRG